MQENTQHNQKTESEQINIEKALKENTGVSVPSSSVDSKKVKKKKKEMNIWVKDIILAVINAGFIIGLFVIMSKVPSRAKQIKSLRSTNIVNSDQESARILSFELENNTEQIKKLEALYPDEAGLISFVDEIEKLRQSGTVENYSFETDNPVKDRTGNIGLPISIEFVGNWEDISADVKKLQELPFMFRPLAFDADEDVEINSMRLDYGGILYVDKSLEKN